MRCRRDWNGALRRRAPEMRRERRIGEEKCSVTVETLEMPRADEDSLTILIGREGKITARPRLFAGADADRALDRATKILPSPIWPVRAVR